jgi:NAD(P)-dependent dehydrogenase (short-subunit alcohol dehydrogenase family)
VEGFETTLAVNYLGVFLLTRLLLEALRAAAPSRNVDVSSDSHRMANIDFAYLRGKRRYAGYSAYGETKLAMTMFTYELARRLQGSGITCNAVHPGFTATRMYENSGGIVKLFSPLIRLMGRSAEEGANTVVYIASSAEVEGVTGKYFADRKTIASSPGSYDETAAQNLYRLTEEVVGLP